MVLILIYSLTYLSIGVSELDFWCSGVVNGLVRGVLVPMYLLNDTYILYITNAIHTNTLKT